jgi:hypothetical protein
LRRILKIPYTAEIPPGKRHSLTVAIGAEHSQIFESPIALIAVHVIELDDQWLSAPFANPAPAAFLSNGA